MATERQADVTLRQEDLLHSIEEDEETLREAVHELAEATEQKLDFTQYIRASPIAWIVGAFCVGMWLGMRDGSDAAPSSMAGAIDYRRLR